MCSRRKAAVRTGGLLWGLPKRFPARPTAAHAAGAAGIAKVRFFLVIAAIRAQGRLCQLSAINRHNRQLFDLLVGAQQDRGRHCKAERRGGLAVHDHLVFDRKLHRKIARVRAAQDAIDVRGGTTKDVYLVGSRKRANRRLWQTEMPQRLIRVRIYQRVS